MESVNTVRLTGVFQGELHSQDIRDGRRMIFVRFTDEMTEEAEIPIGFTLDDARKLARLLIAAADAEQVARLNSGIDQYFTESIP